MTNDNELNDFHDMMETLFGVDNVEIARARLKKWVNDKPETDYSPLDKLEQIERR